MSIIKSLASMVQPAEDKRSAGLSIYDVLDAGSAIKLQGLSLQYFPESISMDRAVDYATKHPIGGSHPLYQWIHGSERTLSFDAIFTAEVDAWKNQDTSIVSTVEDIGNKIGSFLKNPLTSALSLGRSDDHGPTHVDVASAVSWLMSKTYPLYEKKMSVKPPPKLAIYMPNSGIQTYINGLPIDDTFYCLMTRCSPKYVSFFRSGAPRVVEIGLSFVEIVQVGNKWGFVSRDTFIYNNKVAEDYNKTNGKSIKPPKFGYNKQPSTDAPEPKISSSGNNASIEKTVSNQVQQSK